MTIKEAIENIDSRRPFPDEQYPYVEEDIEAINMAIAAMEKQEQYEQAEAEGRLRVCIDNTPTADVRENVRGEWVINSDGYYPYCSHCKEEPQGHAMTDYCPNCGAQMKR